MAVKLFQFVLTSTQVSAQLGLQYIGPYRIRNDAQAGCRRFLSFKSPPCSRYILVAVLDGKLNTRGISPKLLYFIQHMSNA